MSYTSHGSLFLLSKRTHGQGHLLPQARLSLSLHPVGCPFHVDRLVLSLRQGTGDLHTAPDAQVDLLMVGRAFKDEEEFVHKVGQEETNF